MTSQYQYVTLNAPSLSFVGVGIASNLNAKKLMSYGFGLATVLEIL